MGVVFPSFRAQGAQTEVKPASVVAKSSDLPQQKEASLQKKQEQKTPVDNASEVKTEASKQASASPISEQAKFPEHATRSAENALDKADELVKKGKDVVQTLKTNSESLLGTLATQAEQGTAKLSSVADSIRLPATVDAKLDGTTAQLSRVASEVGTQVKGALGKAADTAVDALSGVADSVSPQSTSGEAKPSEQSSAQIAIKEAQQVGNKAIEAAKKAVDDGVGVLNNGLATISQKVDEFKGQIKSPLEEVAAKVNQATEQVVKGAKDGIAQVQATTREALKAPDQALAQVDLAIKQMATSAQGAVGQAKQAVDAKAGEVAGKLPARAQQEVKAKLDSADQALNQAQAKLSEQKQQLQARIEQYKQAIHAPEAALGEVSAKINEFQAGIAGQVSQVGAQVDSAFGKIDEAVNSGKQAVSTTHTVVNGALGTLGTFLNNGLDTADKAAGKIAAATDSLTNGDLGIAGQQALGAVAQTVAGSAKTAIRTGQEAGNTAIDATVGVAQGVVQNGRDQIKGALSNAQAEIKATLTEATTALTGALDQGKEAIQQLEASMKALDQAQQAIDSTRATVEKARQRFEGLQK